MVSEDRADERPRPRPRERRSSFGRLVARAVGRMFGASKPVAKDKGKGADREVIVMPEAAAPSGGQSLEATLARFEAMPSEFAELKRSLGDVFHRFEDALDHLGIEAKRLSNEASALALMADRLQARLSDLERALNGGEHRRWEAPAREEAPAPEEPQFRPSDQGVSVILAAVPGFQGLMDAQRALSGLPSTEAASVLAYKNGEASLQVVLRQPVSARQIVEGLQQSTGQQILIEESRPEAQRLRLRFVE